MKELGAWFVNDELLLLFVVIAIGLALGRVVYKGMHLGTAGVLFAGLLLSAWFRPGAELVIAPQIKEFGLVLFVYCVGLTSGPGFFAAWRGGGIRMNVVVAVALACGALVACLAGWLFGLDRGQIAGVFCGALTNTPALGAASERLVGTPLASHPALGYSLTYPFGVLGALLLGRAFVRRRREQLSEEIARATGASAKIASETLQVTNDDVIGRSIGELRVRDTVGVIVSRIRRGPDERVPNKYTLLQRGDLVTVVGTAEALRTAVARFGPPGHSETSRDRVDMRRILVSKREFVGRRLAELELTEKFNAQVTRLRRADLDLVPSDDMRLELGDRLRVVAPVERLPELARFLGDSELELAELDYVALAVGISAGLVLAQIPLPLFGSDLSLGSAGGPLIAALLLGRLGRTGSFVWAMPHEANLNLRELGLLLFLSGVGVSAGSQLAGVMNVEGAITVGVGALVTIVTTSVALVLSTRWLQAGVIPTLGAASGLQTQPATLAAAFELSQRSEQTYVAYAVVYPLAMIGKILLAQLIALSPLL